MINKRILVILHRSCGDMGKVGRYLLEFGYELDVRCIIEGDQLPDARDYAGVELYAVVPSLQFNP